MCFVTSFELLEISDYFSESEPGIIKTGMLFQKCTEISSRALDKRSPCL